MHLPSKANAQPSWSSGSKPHFKSFDVFTVTSRLFPDHCDTLTTKEEMDKNRKN
jgi:hypothetical protein